MKNILLVLLTLTCGLVHAESKTVMEFGTVNHCLSESDTQGAQPLNGAYRANVIKIQKLNDSVSFTIQLNFVKCTLSQSGYRFTPHLPFTAFYFTTDNPRDIKHMQATPLDVSLKAYKPGVNKLLFDIPLANYRTQYIQVTLLKSELLDEDQLEQLKNNEPVVGSFYFFVQKTLEYKVRTQTNDKPKKMTVNAGGFNFYVAL